MLLATFGHTSTMKSEEPKNHICRWLRLISIVVSMGYVKNGGLGRNRTADTRLFRALLYRLSYQATFGEKTKIYQVIEFGEKRNNN
jgi:hypothetical protein